MILIVVQALMQCLKEMFPLRQHLNKRTFLTAKISTRATQTLM